MKKVSALLISGFSISLLLAGCQQNTSKSANAATTNEAHTNDAKSGDAKPLEEVRIGLQSSGALVYLRESKLLEKSLEKSGIKVNWVQFQSGPPMLEALNTNNIDFGTTGDTPPIFAQAAGSNLVYVAYEKPSPQSEAVIVPANSTLKSVAELKGKSVAVTKGSSANYTLLKALERDKLSFADIDVKYLQPSDARAAFESGKLDAWTVWEPYLSSAKIELKARVLTDATGLKPNNTSFYLASTDFAQKHPDVVKDIVKAIDEADKAITADPVTFSKMIQKVTNLKPDVALASVKSRNYGVNYITDDIIQAQQQEADTFYKNKLLPKQIQVKDIVWYPPK